MKKTKKQRLAGQRKKALKFWFMHLGDMKTAMAQVDAIHSMPKKHQRSRK